MNNFSYFCDLKFNKTFYNSLKKKKKMITSSTNYASAIILAAGNSDRMGFPKAFLKWNEDITFVEKIILEYKKFGCRNIVVVFNVETKFYYLKNYYKNFNGVKVITNQHNSLGRFFSFKMCLQSLSEEYPCFVSNIDNPFVDQHTLETIFKNRNTVHKGYTVPTFQKQGGHPILLNEPLIDGICHIKENDLNIKDVLARYDKKEIEVENPNILHNINTPDEYKRIICVPNKIKCFNEV